MHALFGGSRDPRQEIINDQNELAYKFITAGTKLADHLRRTVRSHELLELSEEERNFYEMIAENLESYTMRFRFAVNMHDPFDTRMRELQELADSESNIEPDQDSEG